MAKEQPKIMGDKKDKPPKFQKPAASAPKAASKRTRKSFCVSKISNEGNGKKILVYARTGMGKSTLAALAPKPIYIGPDKGLDDLDHPLGLDFDVVPGVETFNDVRDATRDLSLYEDFDTVIYDELRYIQGTCADHCVENIAKEKGGKAKSITDFGWAKGYEHVYNEMRLLQVDMDKLVAAGKNVLLLCQLGQTEKVDATYGDYWYAHPDLYDKKNARCVGQWVAWASYVFKIDWATVEIDGKIGTSSDQRAIFTKPEFSFEAKSRGSKFKEYPAVAFDKEDQDDIWRILFDGD